MAKGKVAVPKEWREFVNEYGKAHHYWYVPKGLAVSVDSIKHRLLVLRQFENTKPWREVQHDFVEALNDHGISSARAEWDGGGAPLARMLKQVFAMLGLAWVQPSDLIELTDVGNEFLESSEPKKVLSRQVFRYQFTNPSVNAAAHNTVHVHPVPFIVEALRNIEGQHITPIEYTLFLARAKNYGEFNYTIELVERFRALDNDIQDTIISHCEQYKLAGVRRSSMLNTIRLNRSYALKFFALSELFEIASDGRIVLSEGQRLNARELLNSYNASGEYIEFDNKADWISFYGGATDMPSQSSALEYYVKRGKIRQAVATKKRQSKSKADFEDFEDMIVSEKALEDYLENNLNVVGDRIKNNLQLVGRQYSTPVGPIDLLAKDRKTGDYVVLELKKGRSADKVFGQCSRYMGWIRRNLASPGQEVHGVIVARSIDGKLKAARDAHDTKVHLIEFELKLGARSV